MVPTETCPDLVIRPATSGDLRALGDLYLGARRAAVPSMPPPVHSSEQVRAWVRSWDLAALEVWLAERADGPVGFAAFTATWLDSLYVEPAALGQGVGSALLELVKARRPGGFGLWVFESNTRARGFYRAHGLVEHETTDGSQNEERRPDVRLEWAGWTPR